MANSPSARKRIRQTLSRTARHGARRSRARRFVRFCEEALAKYASGNASSAKEAKDKGKDKGTDKGSSGSGGAEETAPLSLDEHFRRATVELHRAAQKGALHRKAVARKLSRLAKRMKALTQGEGSAQDNSRVGKGKGSSSKGARRA